MGQAFSKTFDYDMGKSKLAGKIDPKLAQADKDVKVRALASWTENFYYPLSRALG